jgi:hypothetical protein
MAKPSERVAIKVRMKEGMRRNFEAEAKRDGISVNQVIERRLNRTLFDDRLQEILDQVSEETAKKVVKAIAGIMLGHVKDEIAALEALEARTDKRILNLHEAIHSTKEK